MTDASVRYSWLNNVLAKNRTRASLPVNAAVPPEEIGPDAMPYISSSGSPLRPITAPIDHPGLRRYAPLPFSAIPNHRPSVINHARDRLALIDDRRITPNAGMPLAKMKCRPLDQTMIASSHPSVAEQTRITRNRLLTDDNACGASRCISLDKAFRFSSHP